MKRKYVFSLAAAAIGSAALAVGAVQAEGWGGHHGHHHGLGAAKACIVTMDSSQRAKLKGIFSSAEPGLKADREKVKADKEALALAILDGKTDLNSQETTLSTDKATLQAAEDALAVQICQDADLSKAKTLFTGLQKLRQSTHEEARSLFQAARP